MSNSTISVDDSCQTGDNDNASIASSERTVRRHRAVSDASTVMPSDKNQDKALEVIDFIDNCAIRLDFDQRQYDELTKFALKNYAGMIRAHAALIAERDRAMERDILEWKISERLDNAVAKHSLALICCRKLRIYSSSAAYSIIFDVLCNLGEEIDLPMEIRTVASMQEKLDQCIRRHWKRVKIFVKEKISESFHLNFFGRQTHLYSLADSISRGSGIHPSLDFITLVAFLREEYANNHDENYWRRVDHRLSDIYNDCKDDDLALRGELNLFLEKDLELYGSVDDLPHNVKYFYDLSICSLEEYMTKFIEHHSKL